MNAVGSKIVGTGGASPTKKYSACGIFAMAAKNSNAFSDYVDLSLK